MSASQPAPELPLTFSQHALDRMTEMGVTKDECRSARAYPIAAYVSRTYGNRNYVGRRVTICVATQPGEELVVTVLWAEQELYGILGRKGAKS